MELEMIRKNYKEFLDEWQEMTAPSGFDTYLHGYILRESEPNVGEAPRSAERSVNTLLDAVAIKLVDYNHFVNQLDNIFILLRKDNWKEYNRITVERMVNSLLKELEKYSNGF